MKRQIGELADPLTLSSVKHVGLADREEFERQYVAAHERLVRKTVSATGEIIDSATAAHIAPHAKYYGSLMESQSSEKLLAQVEDIFKRWPHELQQE